MRNIRTLAVLAAVLGLATVASAAPFMVTDNFDSYAADSFLNAQGGWTDNGGNNYRIVAAPGGVGSTQGVNQGGGSYQMNWTAHPWNWGTDVQVGDKVIARMDFQANGSGRFDDDRVGWVEKANYTSSNYHFGVQLDVGAGGIETYFRNNSNGRVDQRMIPGTSWADLGDPSGSNWYREELRVEKLTTALGPDGAKVEVYFCALDATGGVIAGSERTVLYGNVDTSVCRGFDEDVYPMFKNYSAQPGNADNAYFEITPEPATMGLLALGGLALLRRRRKS